MRINTSEVLGFIFQQYKLTGTLTTLPGELDLNYRFQADDGQTYILKISHEGEDRQHLEMQNAIMDHLTQQSLGYTLPEVIASQQGAKTLSFSTDGKPQRWVRLLTWVAGDLLARTRPHSAGLLESIGGLNGQIVLALQDFEHPAAHRFLKWDLAQAKWLRPHLSELSRPELVAPFLDDFDKIIKPQINNLPCQVIQNDANDYNLIVNATTQRAVGLIDFGDAVFTFRIADLAILLAYLIMDKPDPLGAAANIVRGFHKVNNLQEKELEYLYTLIGLRLATTVTAAALNRKTEPDHAYHFISEAPAWAALEKWSAVSPDLAYYTFRGACGKVPCPAQSVFTNWLMKNQQAFASMFSVNFSEVPFEQMDLQVDSLDLGDNDSFNTIKKFKKIIHRILEAAEVEYGLGGYGEVRPFYTTDSYEVMGNDGPRWRTVHLGMDVWTPVDMPVYAPLEGTVFSVKNNAGERDYGPTVILEHRVNTDLIFYTLYGHLSIASTKDLKPGQHIAKGEVVAHIGSPPENGNWPAHLHFQVLLDPLKSFVTGDFPGVAFPEEQEVWKSICPDPAIFITKKDISPRGFPALSDLLHSRKKHLGKNLSLSYEQPLQIVRGFKQYLYDKTGRRYLDTCNNVPHVGHQHPRIVRAAQRQTALLNTNTRYLYPQLTDYAAALVATFPKELEVCFLVNSGSEANELALRMARTYTGRQDMLAVEVGYHGNTNAVIEVSSYKFDGKGGSGAPAHTHLLPIPDTYRGEHRDPLRAGALYGAYAQKAIDKLAENGKAPAGFICESILSCGGQIVLPKGYLKSVFAAVRNAGGLCIMDEVQVGFGRVGTHFWGFELQGVVPDIVTLGKPIGNGHPMGAVVTTRKIADAFANGMEYFNTFGGNAVSCAIGQEVLRVVKEEELQENALAVGNHLLAGIRILQEQVEMIGEVRGHGLFLGMELVENRESRTPFPEAAHYLANRMRERGVLMSTDGPFHNVIKIKPPMCFSIENADFLIAQLEIVLKEIEMRSWSTL